MRKFFAAAAALAALAIAAPASAATWTLLIEVDPTRDGIDSQWFGISGTVAPFGLPNQPHLYGSLVVQDVGLVDNGGGTFTSGLESVVSINFRTGSRVWTMADLTANTVIYWNDVTTPESFTLHFNGNNRIGASSSLSDGVNRISCNSCGVSALEASPAPEEPQLGAIPEPTTWALMITGFGMAGAALRRRPPTVFA